MMEVVAGGERAGAPFSRHNVQEWSRLDQLTGLLEHARVETDHWTASTSNSSHHFGKVVDSRSRNLADGGQEQRQQTKQLEVFQANIPGGSVQVIRSSTSSSWQSHKTLSGGSGWTGTERLALPNSENQDFDHLKLVLNPLDLSSQKTKASVGRSGSIGSRRPPSRPRSIVGLKLEEASELADYRQLKELSSICHKAHEEAKQDLSQSRHSPHDLSNGFSCDQNDSITNDDSQVAEANYNFRNSASSEVTKSSGHLSLIRKKSCSSEDLHAVDEDGNEAASVGSDWRRSSKVRRSLQFPPKPNSIHKENIVIPVTKSVSEIKKEIEARKQLVTNSFKTHQWNNFAELEGVLGVVRNGSHEEELKDSSNSSEAGAVSPTKTAAKKRQTFITVESLKEVKGRLRKLNSPVEEILKTDDVDDGIVTEVKPSSPIPENTDNIPKNSVKSYVFGMEVMLRKTKPPIVGTGSLESRSSSKFLTNGSNRSEEWYNRRKSYGFEPVSNQQSNYSSFENSKIESSTDSGICRSSDMFSSWSKLAEKSTNQTSPIKTTHSIVIKPYQQTDVKRAIDIEGDAVIQKGRKTVVNLTGSNVNSSWGWNSKTELSNPQLEVCKESVGRGKIADAIRSLNEKSTLEKQRLSEPITISIPIQQTAKTNNTDPTNLLLKQTNITSSNTDKIETSTHSKNVIAPYSELLFGKDAGETSSIDTKSEFENIPWRGNRTKTLSNFFDSEFKRHSIAVDQAKYLSNKKSYGSYYLNGIHDVNDKEGDAHMNVVPYSKTDRDSNKIITESDHEASEKKQKKVEFCKTEVHFAAEPGRFNIVETDGKPPPSNLYRRRRKTTSDAPNRSGLPEIRFGDTPYEKNMLTTESTSAENFTSKSLTFRGSPVFHDNEKDDSVIFTHPNTTVLQSKQFSKLSHQQIDSTHTSETQNNSEDDNPKPRSILKNNIPKPKPYILGESPDSPLTAEEGSSWGVKLKSIKSDEENSKWQTGSHFPKETEFQRLLKSLKPAANKPPDLAEIAVQPEPSSTAADNGLEVRISSSSFPPDHRRASWSVADRIKNVEDTRGYSTKVNFGPQETTVIDASKIDDVTSRVNASDGLKSSWTIKEQKSSFDLVPRISPSFGSRGHSPLHHRQGLEAAVSTHPEVPRITSISLHYADAQQPSPMQPVALFRESLESQHPTTSFVSRNLLNTDSSGISSKVEMSLNGDRTWSFSKVPLRETTASKFSESDYIDSTKQPSTQKPIRLQVRDITSSPSRFSRNSQSPTKEALFLERTAERNVLYNENNRQMSSSPTSGTSKKVTSAATIKVDAFQNNSRKSDKIFASKSVTNQISKSASQSSSVHQYKHKVEDKLESVKKSDTKKSLNEMKTKERKLSTSSSGRDGWLNTPKEVQARKKSESYIRKQDTRSENKISERTIKPNVTKPNQKRTESPIYQNREIYAERRDSNDNTETESTILEELTKAADQILLAVNGYTDDDSFRASSEDEFRKRREKPTSQPLCTISELPNKKTNTNKFASRQSLGVIKSTRSTDLRREYRSSSKTRVGKTSSNSSMDSGPSSEFKSGDVKPLLSPEDRSKRRAARLLQRASSRELLLQTAASSSEDMGSGSDTGSLRTKRVFRRSRLQNGKLSGSKQDLTSIVAETRTKERVQRSAITSEAHTSHRAKTQVENRCSRHSKTITGSTAGERRERRPQTVVTHSSRTQYVPHSSRSRTRTSHAPRPQCPCF
ncbi:uncharacterized protein LOC124367405 isoform X5 [Homalodisca vitripennis]|uniref:uncharacterized protein LOC124367405 isoform X5 n=1 Tax=Homalodisca vitripennis TaxID=197043 RepID=UPI001EEB1DF8|nr:uncharacterized protein LOC124367405 isoform X5 [Homalodisca vitripennis]